MCLRVLKNIFQVFIKCHPKLNVFSFISKTVRKAYQLSKTRKCSNFSRASQRSLVRMCRTNFRFNGQMLFDKCIFVFLRLITSRTPTILLSKDVKNFAEVCYQVIFPIFMRSLAEKWVFVSTFSKTQVSALTKVYQHDHEKHQNKPPWHSLN